MQKKNGKVDKKLKKICEKGVSLIEALVATAIIGIGFMAVDISTSVEINPEWLKMYIKH